VLHDGAAEGALRAECRLVGQPRDVAHPVVGIGELLEGLARGRLGLQPRQAPVVRAVGVGALHPVAEHDPRALLVIGLTATTAHCHHLLSHTTTIYIAGIS
jgi:cobalamin biosynthesis protein CobD/CbiB